ncbi:isocitrate lyase/PEP mutase family protein [Caenimonas aquaedulcis]|uniref:Isocitrate lyase/PEP mutase family protein n=1 Tax=Caenimonas aquaedulcis TaxID=2793270 RepID=A0A931H980_9BURK|nr:isocitrate lyase/PEP mutase family protein [Caenimonas aquaedulcis]MBG9390668.1 isocitrate lyase/PEP mutase family protein [Caenimonas aquaedulcis]
MPTPNQQLRSLLKPNAGIVIPGAPNALGARIIEDAGFPVVYMTGAGVANSYLGGPDMGLISVSEMAAHVAAFRDAVSIPIIADGDTGFGNALNLVRTIKLYERAGASVIQLEDQDFPKRCGHFDNKSVIPQAEMVQKIKAAVDTRVDADFMILARTDAMAVEGIDAAIERMAAYREAGADLMFVEAPRTVDDLKRIVRELPGPHIVNIVHGGRTPMLPQGELAQIGFAGILYANAAMQSAMLAMKKTMAHLKRVGSLAGAEDAVISFDERQKFVNYAQWAQLEKKYADS